MAADQYTIVHDLLSGIGNAPSGRAYFYRPNTTTPAVVYGDSTGTAIGVSVSLDGNGRATAYTNGQVRMIVQTVGGLTVVDTVISAALDAQIGISSDAFSGDTLKDVLDSAQTAFGGTDYRYVPSASGVGLTPKTWMTGVHKNVMAYALSTAPNVNDGVTPADTAIAAAIAEVVAAGGGVVYFPPGTYLLNSSIPVGGSNIILRGAGSGVSIIKQNLAATNALSATTQANLVFEDLKITSTANSTAAGVLLTNVSDVVFSRCSISNFQYSVDTTNSTATSRQLLISGCSFTHSGVAGARCLRIQGTNSVGTTTVMGSRLWSSVAGAGIGIEVTGTMLGASILAVSFSATGGATDHLTDISFSSASTPRGVFAAGCVFGALSGVALGMTAPLDSVVFIDGGNVNFAYSDASPGQRIILSSAVLPVGVRSVTKTMAGASTLNPLGTTDGFATSWSITANGNITIATPNGGGISIGLGTKLTLAVKNNTAGAITVTMGAGYHSSAAIAPAAGNTTAVTYEYQFSGVWNEISRATVT